MKLETCRKTYDYFSGKASDICRKLAFAGLALVWAFKISKGTDIIIPEILRWAGILLVTGLALDFLHYILGTIIWGVYHRYKEVHETTEEEEFLAPRIINWPANICFALKQGFVFAAYILLVIAMFNAFWSERRNKVRNSRRDHV